MTKEQPQAVNPETQELLKRVYRLKEDLPVSYTHLTLPTKA